MVGESTPFAGAADYSATKAALLGYTRGWARDLGPKGITVNTVQPGPIDTDMNPDGNGEFSDTQKGLTALGRYGTADEVAAAVAFLAGPSSGYITGTTLTVDGRLQRLVDLGKTMSVSARRDASGYAGHVCNGKEFGHDRSQTL